MREAGTYSCMLKRLLAWVSKVMQRHVNVQCRTCLRLYVHLTFCQAQFFTCRNSLPLLIITHSTCMAWISLPAVKKYSRSIPTPIVAVKVAPYRIPVVKTWYTADFNSTTGMEMLQEYCLTAGKTEATCSLSFKCTTHGQPLKLSFYLISYMYMQPVSSRALPSLNSLLGTARCASADDHCPACTTMALFGPLHCMGCSHTHPQAN